MDDLLDFIASAHQLGIPDAADLKLGLATAPVLFAEELQGKEVRDCQRKEGVQRLQEVDLCSCVAEIVFICSVNLLDLLSLDIF